LVYALQANLFAIAFDANRRVVQGRPVSVIDGVMRAAGGQVNTARRGSRTNRTESGRYEIFVRPFPNVNSGRWQVSTSGGRTPVWARSGDELFYLAADGTIQGVRVEGSSSWRSSTPTRALQGNYYFSSVTNPGRSFDIAPDGKRFLVIKEGSDDRTPPPQKLIIVEHWFEELKRLVPTK
jgi:hypothetical protein